MTFTFAIQTGTSEQNFEVEPVSSLYFVGANGGGKTRLAVKIEQQFGEQAHRISAHRALALNPSVAKISEREALRGLRIGHTSDMLSIAQREKQRYPKGAAVSLLDDFDFLVQALFAEQGNISLQSHKAGKKVGKTNFEKLEKLWSAILPHRELIISGDDVQVKVPPRGDPYTAAEMSDGERAAFYLIGQTLMAPENSLIIFDEPELHIHRSIMSTLWDELEALRTDCAFVVISHDLEFIASRNGSKFVLKDYAPDKGWTIEDVPEDSDFGEELTTLILGSRKPVLFVEGEKESLDRSLYRACFPDFTFIPKGSCQDVIHSVASMRGNPTLHRVQCAGLIDADHKSDEDKRHLEGKGIYTLPVCEIENLFLLPEVLGAILEIEGYTGNELAQKRDNILKQLFDHAAIEEHQNRAILRYCGREIDSCFKKVNLKAATDTQTLKTTFTEKIGKIDVDQLAHDASKNFSDAIDSKNAAGLLKIFDAKGKILSIAAQSKTTSVKEFQNWVVREMRQDSSKLKDAISAVLPDIEAG